ncbi:DUF998 domain-containing protein [Streptomyces bacillaris]|uniref:DUF998 domain-containing protein n=1 Tax=Streptomyces bacillaris TaxID=68179 RepID=UPI0036F99D5E
MTDTFTPPRPVRSVATAQRAPARWLMAGGVVAGPLFLAAGLAQGLTRDGFHFTRNAISRLALGEAGWVQTLSSVFTGALLVAGGAGLRLALRGGPARSPPGASRAGPWRRVPYPWLS